MLSSFLLGLSVNLNYVCGFRGSQMQIAKNFENELLSVTEFWSPKIVGQVND